jgi:hypothetical protein
VHAAAGALTHLLRLTSPRNALTPIIRIRFFADATPSEEQYPNDDTDQNKKDDFAHFCLTDSFCDVADASLCALRHYAGRLMIHIFRREPSLSEWHIFA